MTGVSSILSVLVLAAATAAPKAAPIDVFPEALVFEATVVRASTSPWKQEGKRTSRRSIEVDLRVDLVLKPAAVRTSVEGRTVKSTITEISRGSGRLETGSAWGDADLQPGDSFLVFADREDPAAAFAQPTSVYRRQADPALVEDVEWIAEGQKLDVPSQANRLLALLAKSPGDRTLVVGRYVAAVAHRSAGASRAALLDAASHVQTIKLDENGRAELLRSLYVGLAMQDTPPADEAQSLLTASLRTLAASRNVKPEDVSGRLESVVQTYLPWLAKHVPGFASAPLNALPKNERDGARDAARALAGMERFPARARDALRTIANAP